MISVTDIVEKLAADGVRGHLLASPDTLINGPVDWPKFDGAGLAFYTGRDFSICGKWQDPASGLLFLSSQAAGVLHAGPFMFVDDPKLAFVLAAELFAAFPETQIHPSAIISSGATIGANVSVGAYSVIGSVKIGDNVRIGAQVRMSDHVEVGSNVLIMDQVCLGDAGPGSVTDLQGRQRIFPHFEKVYIGDDSVMGTGCYVLRGVLTPTRIGKGVHMGMSCRIGHNVWIGEGTYLAPNVVVGGSAKIGCRCFLGMGCCVADTVRLADEVTVGMNATITRSCHDAGTTLIGPAARNIGTMFSLARRPSGGKPS